MKTNKKVIISSVVAISLAILGFASYTIFSLVGADVSQDNYCRGLTGNAWKNCATNAKALQLYLRDTKNENFAGVLKKLDLVRNLTSPVIDTTKPAQKVTFTANPTTINSGGQVELNWTLENVKSCKPIANNSMWSTVGEITKSFAYGAVLIENTTFELACTGVDGMTKIYSASVTVNGTSTTTSPTISSFKIDSTEQITYNQVPYFLLTISWDSANSTGCVVSSVPATAFDGVKTVSGTGKFMYPAGLAKPKVTLTCTGATGTTPAVKEL